MIPTTLSDFEGEWALTRIIQDRRGAQSGVLKGVAQYVPQKGGLLYEETGTLSFGTGAEFFAERRYHWQNDETEIVIHFADGRFFHRFSLSEHPKAEHFCPPDLYLVSYDFSDWPRWRMVWNVTGPNKDYTSASEYNPLK